MGRNLTLEIITLGDFRMLFRGRDLMESLSSKALALICYLALSRNHTAGRDMLASLFWNEENSESARYNLRFTMWKVKKFFRERHGFPDVLCVDRKFIRLHPDIEVKADIIEVKELYEEAGGAAGSIEIFEKIREIYQGDFLENYEFKNCYKLNDWIFYEKEDLQYLYSRVLHALADHYMKKSALKKAADIYREMIKTNPFIEDFHVALIRVYLAMGDRSSALKQYEKCVNILRDELNVAPMASTREVYDEIVEGRRQSDSEREEAGSADSPAQAAGELVICHNCHESFVQAYDHSEAGLKISTDCGSNVGVAYFWVWNILEEVFDSMDEARLRNIPAYHWKDVMVYNSRIYELLPLEDRDAPLHPADTIRSFSSLLSILKTLADGGGLDIFVENYSNMDVESKDFFLFLSNRLKKGGLKLHICV
ncbi:hypothetical protein C4J81_14430 [Deltaproteobacteria bacterium Smac51]|nr:hypothetical protein C4J81_14430 [Deltaproteobacteria bacterium Smac51]